MIKIERPEVVPAVLAKGAAPVAAMHAALVANPQNAGTASQPFTFNSKIYGHETVKNALLDAQHRKCAYCEGLFLAFSWGDVEHHRPKGFSQQADGGPQIRPGYYWLAYEWTNLLGSCSKCNQLRKKNLFPLRNPANRARTPEQIVNEDPMILDPANDNPRDHIGFKANVPDAITDVGQSTIDAVVLDREDLNGLRLHHLKRVKKLTQIIAIAQHLDDPEVQAVAAESEAELESLKAPDAPFSAMTLCFLGL